MTVKIIDNCCSLKYLDTLKHHAETADNWNMSYPNQFPIENRHLKLDIMYEGRAMHPILAGLATGLLIQIHEAAGQDSFLPQIGWCGISMKDKHTINNKHSDEEPGHGFVKILGLLNSDWKEEWGGGFFHNGTSNYIKPTSFCIFDPSEMHANEEIFTDKKRFAIDFTVFLDRQSLDQHLHKKRIQMTG